jgi:hypothetical protein
MEAGVENKTGRCGGFEYKQFGGEAVGIAHWRR